MPEEGPLEELARWCLAIDATTLPPRVVQQAELLILDTIGCALAAGAEPDAARIRDFVAAAGGAPRCTVIGAGLTTTVTDAVLANGALLRLLDLNDFLFQSSDHGPVLGGHPSDNIAVALSVGEWRASSGREVIAAVVEGYEIYDRLKDFLDTGGQWDGTSVSGIAAPAMAGRLMGLGPKVLAHALALGAARATTPGAMRAGHISASKYLANALIAQSGVQAAMLAEAGLTGPLEVMTHARGLHPLYGRDRDFGPLTKPLAEDCAILQSNVKTFPCVATAQTTVAAAQEIHRILEGSVDAIDRIEVIMADNPVIRRQQSDPGRLDPHSREAADHSFPFLCAITLIDGELTARQFEHERWNDPAVRTLMDKTTLGTDSAWSRRPDARHPCTLRVSLRDGASHKVEVAVPPGISRGGLEPEIVFEKFDAVTRDILPDATRADVRDTVMSLHHLADVGTLMAKLAALPASGRATTTGAPALP